MFKICCLGGAVYNKLLLTGKVKVYVTQVSTFNYQTYNTTNIINQERLLRGRCPFQMGEVKSSVLILFIYPYIFFQQFEMNNEIQHGK